VEDYVEEIQKAFGNFMAHYQEDLHRANLSIGECDEKETDLTLSAQAADAATIVPAFHRYDPEDLRIRDA